MSEGWFKYYRSLIEHPIRMKSLAQSVVIDTILGNVNHKTNKWVWNGKEFEVEPGQWITSVQTIINKSPVGLTRQNVRTALGNLEKANFLTIESTKTGIKITVVNWGIYQGGDGEPNQHVNQDLTKTQPTPNQDLTTNNNDKNIKNDKKKYILSKFDDFWREYPKKESKQAALKSFSREATSEEQADIILESLQKQKDVWEKKRTAFDFLPLASTWLNQKRYEDDFETIFLEISKGGTGNGFNSGSNGTFGKPSNSRSIPSMEDWRDEE